MTRYGGLLAATFHLGYIANPCASISGLRAMRLEPLIPTERLAVLAVPPTLPVDNPYGSMVSSYGVSAAVPDLQRIA